ncbi:hypothetical protein NNG48_07075 [Enterococcus faecium]|nr:hypothetical protein [Enterococcus faecium]
MMKKLLKVAIATMAVVLVGGTVAQATEVKADEVKTEKVATAKQAKKWGKKQVKKMKLTGGKIKLNKKKKAINVVIVPSEDECQKVLDHEEKLAETKPNGWTVNVTSATMLEEGKQPVITITTIDGENEIIHNF